MTDRTSQLAAFASHAMGKNLVINGAMQVNQWNAAVSISMSGGEQFPLDRMVTRLVATNSQTMTAQQVTDAPPGFTHSLKFTTGTGGAPNATDIAFVKHRIMGLNLARLNWGTSNAQPAVFGVWFKSSVSGPFGVNISNGAAGSSVYATTFAYTGGSGWQFIWFVVPGPTSGTFATDNTNALELCIDLGSGTSRTVAASSVWQSSGNTYGVTSTTKLCTTAGATLQITGLQFEQGEAATNYEWRHYSHELDLCQWYFEKIADEASGGFGYVPASLLICTSTTQAYGALFYKRKRGIPTISTDGGTASYRVTDELSAWAITAFAFDPTRIQTYSAEVGITVASGLTSGKVVALQANNTNTPSISIIAEL